MKSTLSKNCIQKKDTKQDIANTVLTFHGKITKQTIISCIEKNTGKCLEDLKKELSDKKLFFIGLQYVVTTKKMYCLAIDIPLEAGCRYKRFYEKVSQLVQSNNKVICPATKHWAHLISTNPHEFSTPKEPYNIQLRLF